MDWQPPNLTQLCPANSQLSACSYFGYFFLNFLLKLYNDDHDRRVQGKLLVHDGTLDYDGGEYDFIVVGAGTAGCVLANRLSEVQEWTVLLIEAGPLQPEVTMVPGMSTVLLGSSIDWGYSAQPDGKTCLARIDGRCPWSRGKVMGGTSTINTLVYIRGNKLDYDGWAEMGNEGWSFRDVLPYFKKSEKNLNIEVLDRKYHGSQGPQSISRFPFIDKPSITITKAFNEMGLPLTDLNGPEQVGTMQAQAFSAGGQRASTNTAYIDPIKGQRVNLIIKTKTEAVKLLIDENNKVYGVKYIRKGKAYIVKTKKEVIVSAGAINSPKLLLISGIGPKEDLEKLHIPVLKVLPVGENLQDHLTFTGLIIAFSNDTATTVDNERMLELVQEYKEDIVKRGPLSSTGPYNSISFFKTDPELPAPDIQIQTENVVWREYLREPINFERIGIFPSVFYDGVIPRVQNVVPKSRGKITLNTTNPYGPPYMYANYLKDPSDIEPIKRGVQMLKKLEETDVFKSGKARFIKEPLEACRHTTWGTDEYVECMTRHYTLAVNHEAGSCKMGPKWDKTAVVDPRLRVHGVSGLRVIDASIMPVLIRGNTNGPTMMIAEKGADMIKEDWPHTDSTPVPDDGNTADDDIGNRTYLEYTEPPEKWD